MLTVEEIIQVQTVTHFQFYDKFGDTADMLKRSVHWKDLEIHQRLKQTNLPVP